MQIPRQVAWEPAVLTMHELFDLIFFHFKIKARESEIIIINKMKPN